ncbi:uncharacterized protein I206_106243 [Kwoniella pini CBS 10737]|uniref:Uncharacterized protein n=1 Tax=Kwoniella pini CBS 10737 TaxID=1296096 RepID=A0A1B9I1F6_9TREE|nr:uncharacterized protein I206_05069 [Kwoniella pini CBS 10737]OCF49376.1 hypothetical protein I206_05069 [Kwoniella pini CBS 10737]
MTKKGFTKCDVCYEKFEIDLNKLLPLVERGEEILEKDSKGQLDYQDVKNDLINLIENLQKYIPNYSYPLFTLLRISTLTLTNNLNFSKTQKSEFEFEFDFELCLNYLRNTFEASKEIFSENHSNKTLILAEYSKFLNFSFNYIINNNNNKNKKFNQIEIISKKKNIINFLENSIKFTELSFGKLNKGGIVGKELNLILNDCKLELDNLNILF